MKETNSEHNLLRNASGGKHPSEGVKNDETEHKIIRTINENEVLEVLGSERTNRRRSKFFKTTVSRRKYLFKRSCCERDFFFTLVTPLRDAELAFEEVERLELEPVGVGMRSVCVSPTRSKSSSISVSSVSASVSVSVILGVTSPTIGFCGVTGCSFVRLTEGKMGMRLAIALGFP